MRTLVALGLIIGLLTGTSAQAGPLRAAAIRHGTLHAAPALPQAGNQERRRSMARTWGGVGLIGAGIVTAFYSQECGTMGSLGPPATASDGLLTAAFSASELQPLEVDGKCYIDFSVHATLAGNYTGRVYENVSGQFSDSTSEEKSLIRQTGVQGSAATRTIWPTGRMYAGLGIAAVGALVATMFADVDVPVALTRLDRSGVAVGTRLRW